MNPGEIAAISGYSIKTLTRHLLDLMLSEEMDAWDYVRPFLNEERFIDIATTLRAVTEERVEPEVYSHLKRFYSETELNIALIRLIHDKNVYHKLPELAGVPDIASKNCHSTEFVPLLPDITNILTYGTLINDLTDKQISVRKRSAKMLGYLGEPEAIVPLTTQLGEKRRIV